jgi:hypothetical protein
MDDETKDMITTAISTIGTMGVVLGKEREVPFQIGLFLSFLVAHHPDRYSITYTTNKPKQNPL